LGEAVLTAAAVMFGGLFAPFVTQGCIFCALDYTIPSRSLVQSLDAWILVSVVVALGLVTLSYLRNPRHRTAALTSLVLAATALALGIFQWVDAYGRVIGEDNVPKPVELGNPGATLQGIAPPIATDFGAYLFVGAAIAAVVATIGIVLMTRHTKADEVAPAAVPLPSALP
jgi:hypothetical protein